MVSIFKFLKQPVKINQNIIKLFTHFRFRNGNFDFKNNVLLNKFKEWYTYFSSPNEAKHLKDIFTKQQYLQQMQDERREISKLLTDVRKLNIEKQDKIFRLNKWENAQEYVALRKEEAELIKKEYELRTKFDALDRIEKEFFMKLNSTVLGSYEREKTKKVYTKYWGTILAVVIVLISGLNTRITDIEEKSQMYNVKPIYTVDNTKIETNDSVILVAVGIVVMFIICKICC